MLKNSYIVDKLGILNERAVIKMRHFLFSVNNDNIVFVGMVFSLYCRALSVKMLMVK